MTTIGINGFGRMGRLGIRAAWDNPGITFTHINEIAGDATTSAHLLKFDSIHGTWPNECSADGSNVTHHGRHPPRFQGPQRRSADFAGGVSQQG